MPTLLSNEPAALVKATMIDLSSHHSLTIHNSLLDVVQAMRFSGVNFRGFMFILYMAYPTSATLYPLLLWPLYLSLFSTTEVVFPTKLKHNVIMVPESSHNKKCW